MAIFAAAACTKKTESIGTPVVLCTVTHVTATQTGADPYNFSHTYTRNAAGTITSETIKDLSSTALATTTDYTYSSNGLSVTLTEKNASGAVRGTTLRTLNPDHYITEEVSPANAVTTYTYDTAGHLRTSIDGANNVVTSYTWVNGNKTMERNGTEIVLYTYGPNLAPASGNSSAGLLGKQSLNLPISRINSGQWGSVTSTYTYQKNSNGYPVLTTVATPKYAATTGGQSVPATTLTVATDYSCP